MPDMMRGEHVPPGKAASDVDEEGGRCFFHTYCKSPPLDRAVNRPVRGTERAAEASEAFPGRCLRGDLSGQGRRQPLPGIAGP
jgi:hypothetical protein